MILRDVTNRDLGLLYEILKQRTPETNISHREMPSWGSHVAFVTSKPYKRWWVLSDDGHEVGAAYVSKQNEVGIFIMKEYRGRGYGPRAVKAIVDRVKEPLLANVNPANAHSAAMFQKLGFRHVQNTYRFSPSK